MTLLEPRENVKQLAWTLDQLLEPYATATTLAIIVVSNLQLPLREFHHDVTLHRLSLSGRRWTNPASLFDLLLMAGQVTPAT